MPRLITVRLALSAALLAGNLLACAPAHAENAVIVVTQAVRDFAAWKKAFDADKPSRDKDQIAERFVVRDAESPNLVTVIFEAAGAADVKAFVANLSSRQAMQSAGVLGPPVVTLGTVHSGR